MTGLTGCPRLKKLWLCQNQITTIADLHNLPELEELWLQSNRISSLQGLENCRRLNHLGVAGNYISDFAEIRRLSALSELKILNFQDIHFGRCPISDSAGYKDFVLNHLKQVWF
jgi:protein phosphatase 1 regulatory subunit 7